MHRCALSSVALGLAAGVCCADFVVPSSADEGWDRGVTPGSLWAEWDSFETPFSPNRPDVGSFVGGVLAADAVAFDVFDRGSSSFITSGGNIYSFSDLVLPQIDFGGFGLGIGQRTTILVQVRTQGNELDPATVLLDGAIAPAEIVELDRRTLGGFGGVLVDTLIRFEVGASAAGHAVTFDASASSMSLDRVAVDAFTRPAGCNAADVAAPLGQLTFADISVFISAFSVQDPAADLAAPSGAWTFADISTFLALFGAGCP